jgi:hypothetical protein
MFCPIMQPSRPAHSATASRAFRTVWRSIVFDRFTWPSTRPLLHRSAIGASIAVKSRQIPSVTPLKSGQVDASTSRSHSPYVSRDRWRIIAANSASSYSLASSLLHSRIASTLARSSGLRFLLRRTPLNQSCFSVGNDTSADLTACNCVERISLSNDRGCSSRSLRRSDRPNQPGGQLASLSSDRRAQSLTSGPASNPRAYDDTTPFSSYRVSHKRHKYPGPAHSAHRAAPVA